MMIRRAKIGVLWILALLLILLCCDESCAAFPRNVAVDLGVGIPNLIYVEGQAKVSETWQIGMGYGLLGAAAGLATGLLFVWIAVLAVRLIGTVAEVQVSSACRAAKTQQPGHAAAPQPNSLVVNVAQMKRSIEQGPAGGIMKAVDPLPPQTYEIVDKIGRVMDDREIADRFMNFPGVKTLSQLPKIVALTSDEEIIRELRAKNYIALLKNKHIVEVANDPQINSMVGKVDFQKALDYALEK